MEEFYRCNQRATQKIRTLDLKLPAIYRAGSHRRFRQLFGIPEAEYTRAVVAKTLHLKLLSMYKVDTSVAEFQGQEMAIFGGTAGVHRRILEPFDILEATRSG